MRGVTRNVTERYVTRSSTAALAFAAAFAVAAVMDAVARDVQWIRDMQLELFAAALSTTTADFHAACRARDVFDFFTDEYRAAMAATDALYARMRTIQSVVAKWWLV